MEYSALLQFIQVALALVVIVGLFLGVLSYVRYGLSWRLPVIFVIMVLTVLGITYLTPSKIFLVSTDSCKWRTKFWVKRFVDVSTGMVYDIQKGRDYVFLTGRDSAATAYVIPVYYSTRPSQFGEPVKNPKEICQIPMKACQLIDIDCKIDYLQRAPDAIETVQWAKAIVRWVLTIDPSCLDTSPKYRRAEIVYCPPVY